MVARSAKNGNGDISGGEVSAFYFAKVDSPFQGTELNATSMKIKLIKTKYELLGNFYRSNRE